ncbi:MAG: hypothetical protein O2944_04650 [Proteobacteria bacterium]|nr:hypothetical protein [Pseudomonadota bacterium]
MKLGPKLILVFAAIAVLPILAASVVFLDATRHLGQELIEHSRTTLEERLRADIRRSVEEAGIAVAEDRRRIEDRLRFLASDISERLSAAVPAGRDISTRYIFTGDDPPPRRDADLERYGVSLANDAPKDKLRDTLLRLADGTAVSRSVYFQNRGIVARQFTVFDNGLTLSYPGGGNVPGEDLREAD